MSKIDELEKWIFKEEGFVAPDVLSSDCMVGEAIAWELAHDRIGKEKQKIIVVESLKCILNPILHTELKNLKLWELDVHIANKAPNKANRKKHKRAIRHSLLSFATTNELISPKLRDPEQCPIKKWIENQFESPKELSKDSKIGELIAYLLAERKISCAEIPGQDSLIATIDHIANITLKDFKSKYLFAAATKACEETSEKWRTSREEKIRSSIKTLFLDPAIKKKLLEYVHLRKGADKKEDFMEWVSDKSDNNIPKILTAETTFEQYLGWLTKNNKLNVDNISSLDFFKKTIEKLIGTKLKDLNTEKILSIHSHVGKAQAGTLMSSRSSFKKVIMEDAIVLGICKLEKPRPAITNFKNWVTQQADNTPVSSSMTFGQFVAYLIRKNKLDEELLLHLSKPYAKKVINQTFKTKLSDLRWKDIQSATEAYKKESGVEQVATSAFRQVFLDPAIEMGVLDKEYGFRSDLKYMISHQLKSLKHTRKKDRTVGFYIAKIYENGLDKQTKVSSNYIPLLDIWNIKASSLTIKDIPNLTRRETAAFRRICDMMTKDGLLKFDFYIFQEKQKNRITINMKNDKWKIPSGVNSYNHLNFEDIKSRDLKNMAKKYMKWRIMKESKGNGRALRDLKKGLLSFLSTTDRTPKQFTNTAKKEWLLWLKGRFSDNEGKHVFYAGKSFLKYHLEVHPKSLYSSLNLSNLDNPFKTNVTNVKQYEQWEIDQIINGIKRHNNRQFADILTLIMLTAKRKGEILSLKRDCLINIAGIKYLKYTDHKNNAEKRVPLQSFKLGGAPTLFHKDVETIIEEIIERQLAYSKDYLPYCHPEERDLLLIKERVTRNSMGYNFGAVTSSLYKKDKNAFVDSHRIQFSLDAHRFRHTIGSKIIRSGKGVDMASRVLGNHPKTTSKHYEADVSKEETMRLQVSPKVSALEDAKELAMFNKAPTVIRDGDTIGGSAMPGGRCLEGEEAKLSCRFYQRLFGSGGCLGCGSLGYSEENRFYYEDLKHELLVEMEEVKGTPASAAVTSKLNLVNTTLKNLDTIGAI